MPWSKGQSGNPGGRPKALVEVQELARAETAANIRALVRIRDAEDTPPAAVVTAATALLDRAWGKPVATHEISGDLVSYVIHAPPPCETVDEWMERYAKPELAKQERLKAIEGALEPPAPEPPVLEPPDPATNAAPPLTSRESAEWPKRFDRGRDYR